MPINVPYSVSPGAITKALEKIKDVPTPPKVTQDFVKTKLGIAGGTGNAILSYLRKIGFVAEDGSPTEIYNKFRNPSESAFAIAEAFKIGYSDLYAFNEYFHDLDDKKIEGLLIQHGGYEKGARPIELIISSINRLKAFASFEKEIETGKNHTEIIRIDSSIINQDKLNSEKRLGMNLSYTINLNLPATNDISVYNAIFKSLKDNLLYEK